MGVLYEAIVARTLQPGHWFTALMGEFAVGDISAQDASTVFTGQTGIQVTGTLQTEINDLIATVTVIPVPAVPSLPAPPGTINAANAVTYATSVRNYAQTFSQRAEGLAQRAHKVRRIMQIFFLHDQGAPGYTTVQDLRDRLGVPTR
jgi:hypothetical protein